MLPRKIVISRKNELCATVFVNKIIIFGTGVNKLDLYRYSNLCSLFFLFAQLPIKSVYVLMRSFTVNNIIFTDHRADLEGS